MIFGKKRKYPLPKFPPDVKKNFLKLTELLSDEDARSLIPQVDQCLAEFEQESTTNQLLNIELARKLARCSKELLDTYHAHTDAEKPLILGAVRYFAVHEDSMSEHAFATGFDDDVRVMNHVLEEIGREDLVIPLR